MGVSECHRPYRTRTEGGNKAGEEDYMHVCVYACKYACVHVYVCMSLRANATCRLLHETKGEEGLLLIFLILTKCSILGQRAEGSEQKADEKGGETNKQQASWRVRRQGSINVWKMTAPTTDRFMCTA